MGAKKFFCILDTETVTNARKVFDLGYKVIDRQGNVYETGSYVVAEQVDTIDGIAELIADRFSSSKSPIYFNDIINGNKEFEVAPFDIIREIVNDAIRNYHATVCAYNLAFDMRALNKTSQLYCGCDFFEEMPETIDIWGAAMSTICAAQKYIKFIVENNLLTDNGNPKTGAETVYQFITNDVDFMERHTALADCDIEHAIFNACIRTHKKMNCDTVGMCCHNCYWQDIVARYRAYTA